MRGLVASRPPTAYPVRRHLREGARNWSIRTTACLTVGLAPLEGYLVAIRPELAKVPAILLALSWAYARLRERRLPAPHIAQLLLAALAVVVILSGAAQITNEYTLEYVSRWLPFLAVTAILIDVVSKEVDVDLLLASAVAGAAFASVGALYSMIVLGDTRATGPMQDPNDLAFVLAGALPLALAPALGRGRAAKLGMAALSALMIMGIGSTFSRGGVLALIAAFLWLYIQGTLNAKKIATSLAMVVVAGTVALVAAWPHIDRALSEKEFIADSNVDSRFLRWQAAFRMLAEHPMLGVGPGGFRSEYVSASRMAELDQPSPVAHNMYFEVAAELGVVGFLLFAGIIATAFVSCERAVRLGADRWTAASIQSSLLAMLVAACFLSEQYYMSLWALIAIACGYHLRAEKGHS